jgi:CcmD family protein
MAYMVAAYLVIWAAAFGFILSMARRQSRLEREIAGLKEALAREAPR